MKSIAKTTLFLLVLGCFFALGFGWREVRSGRLPSKAYSDLVVGRQTGTGTPQGVFESAYKNILFGFYKLVAAKDLKYAAMEGLMASLGDPHTMFLPPQAAEDFSLTTRANFDGIGARLLPDALGAKIMSVFREGPAAKAGLKPGDLIAGVNGHPVTGWAIDKIVGEVKGPRGTTVRLQIARPNEPKPVFLTIERRHVVTPTVDSQFLADSSVGYMSVASFSQPTAEQFDQELGSLEQHKLKGLIIDLRSNPGGLLDVAVDMVSRFTADNRVVTLRFRDGHEEYETAHQGMQHGFRYPVVVLLNDETASAAEIFSGALRDYKLITIFGDYTPGKTAHSYGKSEVQNVFDLKDGSGAKITIAKYLLPNGEDIGRRVDDEGQFISGGLIPDQKVEVDPDVEFRPGDPKTDLLLKKAVEFVLAKQ